MAQFDPQQHARNVARQGEKPRWYLDVKWRILWFRTEHPVPQGRITTSIHELPSGLITVHASVWIDDVEVATGMATVREATDKREQSWAGRITEKAETAAIGRALDLAGYGTQFMDGDRSHLADAPVDQPGNPAQPNIARHIPDPKATEEPPPPVDNGKPAKKVHHAEAPTLAVKTIPDGKTTYMVISGARLYSRKALKALGFDGKVYDDLGKPGDHILPDEVMITYTISNDGRYNLIESILRSKTGEWVNKVGDPIAALDMTA